MAVYTFLELESACVQIPEKKCYISDSYLKLSRTLFMLHDPEQNILAYTLAAADNVLVQVLFKSAKIVLGRSGHESPVFRLRITEWEVSQE